MIAFCDSSFTKPGEFSSIQGPFGIEVVIDFQSNSHWGNLRHGYFGLIVRCTNCGFALCRWNRLYRFKGNNSNSS